MVFLNKTKRTNPYNNRINLLIAIVFLFGVVIVFKLYSLQISKYELYLAKADSQHQIYNKLEPERGKIFIIDYERGEEVLYPFATNKDFALIYAVPAEMENAQDKAEKLFLMFNYEKVVLEVDEYFEEKDKEELEFELSLVADWPDEERIPKEAEIKYRFNLLRSDSTWLEVRLKKKEEEIEKRGEKIVRSYLKILNKGNDPYEPLQKKVDKEKLKQFYALLLSGNEEVDPDELVIKNGGIYKSEGDELEEVRIRGISHIIKKYRYYPESSIGAHVLGFVNVVNNRPQGNYGLEGFFDRELFGQFGSVKSGRGANQEVIILNDREYIKPKDGNNLILSINRSIQFIACQKLAEAGEKHDADGGSIIVVEPKTGAIIAMCSWPEFDPNNYNEVEDISIYNNPVVFQQYEPGSVFKTITMAVAMDQNKISPNTLFNDNGNVMIEGWPKPIRNSDFETHGAHGMVDMNYVLVHSLNTGAIFAMQQAGPKTFSKYVRDFGFGERTGIELESENNGNIDSLLRKTIRPVEAATASFGQGITVTPLQMLMSYAAIANNGILMKPFIVREVVYEDGGREITKPIQIRRVISERTANFLIGMMANVVEGGHATQAGVEGYFVGGKTGTAQVVSKEEGGYSKSKTIHNFVGFAPVNDPRFVMLVKLDDPKDVSFSASSAAPLFGQISEFILKYYQVPKER
jgi:cell division protein FtsI/penicillin-binding protein 2